MRFRSLAAASVLAAAAVFGGAAAASASADDGSGTTPSGSTSGTSTAGTAVEGTVSGSNGQHSGTLVQHPVDETVNYCGNTVNEDGHQQQPNPSVGNVCLPE